jgi:hypothetical protein
MQIFWSLCSSTRVSDMHIVYGLSSVRSRRCKETIMKLIVLNFKLKTQLVLALLMRLMKLYHVQLLPGAFVVRMLLSHYRINLLFV